MLAAVHLEVFRPYMSTCAEVASVHNDCGGKITPASLQRYGKRKRYSCIMVIETYIPSLHFRFLNEAHKETNA